MPEWAARLFYEQFPVVVIVCVVAGVAVRFTVWYTDRQERTAAAREDRTTSRLEAGMAKLDHTFQTAVDRAERRHDAELDRQRKAHAAVVRAKNAHIKFLVEQLRRVEGKS